jgi:hypothetical protein
MDEKLSQRIDRDVRQLIGDLHMQTIVLRNMLDLQQLKPERPEPPPVQEPPQEKPEPEPERKPEPLNAEEVRRERRTFNGHRHDVA